jgi:1-acyl-sn-glycerol-3-phosphate acyltransferase
MQEVIGSNPLFSTKIRFGVFFLPLKQQSLYFNFVRFIWLFLQPPIVTITFYPAMIKLITNILQVLWKVYFLMMFVLSALLLFPLFYILLSQKKWFHIAFKLERAWAFILCTLTGIIIQIKKESEFPPPPYVVCPNHSSYLDIVLMYLAIPDFFAFMGKAELGKWPLVRMFFNNGMNILVDRKSSIKSHKAFVRAGEEIDNEKPIIIFPEGTIPANVPKMRPFKNGAFKLAIEKQVPIVPISFVNNYRLLKNGSFWKAPARPGISRIIVHKPIFTIGLTDDDADSIKLQTFQTIQKEVEKPH